MSTDDDIAEDFRDIDPEDEWDDLDPFRVRLEVLERILEHVREHRDDRFRLRLTLALGLIARMINEHVEDMERLNLIKAALNELEAEG